MITEDYVSFEIAKLLKEKGFNEGCSFVVNTISKGVMPVSWPTTNSDIVDEKTSLIALPTLQMAMKWLREVHHIYASPVQQGNYNDFSEDYTWIVSRNGIIYRNKTVSEKLSYEEACEAAIMYALENLI